MNDIAQELRAANPHINIELIGVNRADAYSGNAAVTESRSLPWLQDNFDDAVWTRWNIVYRDVRILDTQNRLRATYNLSSQDLSIQKYRDAFKALLLDAATVIDSDRDGLPDDWELRYFSDLTATAVADRDRDGFDNFTEFAFGTLPTNASSFPAVKPAYSLNAKGEKLFSIQFRRHSGALLNYRIESSSNLADWAPSQIPIPLPINLFDGTGAAHSQTTFTLPSAPQSFFRVRALAR